VGPGCGRLLPRHSAAHSIEFEAEILSSFDSAAHGLPNERWNFDSTLLDVQNDGTAGGQLL
jgi:hypothetical protein